MKDKDLQLTDEQLKALLLKTEGLVDNEVPLKKLEEQLE